MSETNVKIARRGYEAFARGDMQAVLSIIDQHVEVDDAAGLPDAGVWQGHEGVLAALAEEDEHQEEWSFVPVRFVDAGDRVVVLIEQRARGRFSGIDMTRPVAHVWRFENERGVAMRTFSSWEEGLAAAGLDPDPSVHRD